MAKETHVINVSPKDENRVIRVFQTFGWNMVGNQSVYSRDSYLENRGGSIYSVTKTRDYVKLTFERDGSKLKNYAQLCQLEKEYYAIPVPKKPGTTTVAILVTLGITGLFLWLIAMFFKAMSVPEIALPMRLISILFIGIAVYLYINFKKKHDNWKKDNADCWNRRDQVLRKAEAFH